MDNLEKLWCHSVIINEKECGKSISCSYAEDIACFITDKNYLCTYQHFKLSSRGAAQRIVGNGKLKHVHYLSFYDTIFGASDFDFYIIGRHTFETKYTYVTLKRIARLCWNPNETGLVVVFDDDDIIIYNYCRGIFTPRYTSHLHVEVSSSVYVGWGSQNTQFQGPRALESAEEVVTIDQFYARPTIAWRSEGDQIVINYYREGKRYIKVFDNELKPLYMSDEYVNLRAPMSFMPMGQYIASCAVRNNVNTIVIFEKNCQVKTTFKVPENKGDIKKMEYHSHMNMLAVYSKDSDGCCYLNIYLSVNAHWCLKHQLFFPPEREVRDFQWVNLPDAAFTICKLVVFTSKNVEYHTFRFIISRCPNTSITAVTEGTVVDFYDFDEKTVPPPMKLCSLTFEKPINQILFHPTRLFAFAVNCRLQVIVIDLVTYTKLVETNDMLLENIGCVHNVEWNDEDSNVTINIAYSSPEELYCTEQASDITLDVRTFRILEPKYVLPYNDTECLKSIKILTDEFSSLMYLTKIVLPINNNIIDMDFALSSNLEFYVNEKFAVGRINSLFVYKHYLLFTSTNSRLYCMRLMESYEQLLRGLDLSKVFSRDIEQNSRIVNCTSDVVPQIILQAPRGNLESVQCRLMAVDVVERLLRVNDWKGAISIMREGKINWNVLIDLNPQRFILNIEEFSKAAEYCSVLSTVVNDFGIIDSSYNLNLPSFAEVVTDKSDIVKKILEYLLKINCPNNLLAIVAIQQKHVSAIAALRSIKVVFETANECREQCKKALQYLLLKEHFKDIIYAGYSFFSINFLEFIYNNSSEDPRVYEPEIEELRTLDPIELRFKMSVKATNMQNSVKFLLRCDNYNTVFVENFITRYKLETVAYHGLPENCKYEVSVATLYARYLSKHKRHSEAAFVLSKVNLLQQALEEHKKALNWMEAAVIMDQLKYNEAQKREVLYDISEQLMKARRVDDAVFLLEHHLRDYEKAIQVLVDHKAFTKALGFAKMHKLQDVIDDLILPNVSTYMTSLGDRIDDYKETFEKYVQRLKVVRVEKQNLLDNPHEASLFYDRHDPESDSDSTISGSSRDSSRSRGSTMSSKNRRKEERKKTDLRQGGYYEDIALIRALHMMYTEVFGMGQEVRDICLMVEHGNLEMSRTIHDGLSQLQDDMKMGIPEIWPDVFLNAPQIIDNSIIIDKSIFAIVQNKPALDPKYYNPPSEDILNAKWKLEIYAPTL